MKNKYYPHLFEKGKIGNVVIKNRIVRNSMGTYLGNPDGTVTDRQIKAYAQAADGGAGLIFMDNAVPGYCNDFILNILCIAEACVDAVCIFAHNRINIISAFNKLFERAYGF